MPNQMSVDQEERAYFEGAVRNLAALREYIHLVSCVPQSKHDDIMSAQKRLSKTDRHLMLGLASSSLSYLK